MPRRCRESRRKGFLPFVKWLSTAARPQSGADDERSGGGPGGGPRVEGPLIGRLASLLLLSI